MSRIRPIAATLGALALVGGTLLVGAMPASAYAPTNVLLNELPLGVQVDDSPVSISGTVDHSGGGDQTIVVSVSADDGPAQPYCTGELTIYDPVADGVSWSCSSYDLSALPYGVLAFTAVSYENATPGEVSPTSAPQYLTVGSSDPVVITSPAASASTYDATPAISGTGPHLGTVQVFADGNPICSSPVDSSGAWACNSTPLESYVADPLAWSITYAITAVGTLADATTQSPTSPQDLTIMIPAAPTTQQTFSPWYTGSPTPQIQGTMGQYTTGVTVWRSTDGTSWWHFCDAPTTELATVWYCDPETDVNSDVLSYGLNYLASSTTNDSGQLSTLGPQIQIYRLHEATVSLPLDDNAFTTDTTPTFTGTVDPLATTVDVRDGSTIYCSATPTAGAWSCTPASPFGDGTYSYFVYNDPLPGATSETRTITIDTVAPTDPEIFTSGTTTDATPTITGTAEDFAVVTVYVDGNPVTCATPPVVDETNQWSCTLAAPLSFGPHSLSAVQTDRAGNSSNAGVPPVLTTLTVEAPPVPATPLITSPVNGFSTSESSVVVSGDLENLTGDNYVVLVSGSSGSETITCDALMAYYDSSWSCTLYDLPAGTISITAIAYVDNGLYDPPSATSNVVTITRDTIAKPTMTYALGPASIGITGTARSGFELSVEFYRVTTVSPVYSYETIGYCGTDSGGEGGGAEGEFTGADLTFAVGSAACTYGGLAPGIYNVYANQYSEGGSSEYQNDYVLIPSAPSLAAEGAVGGVTLSGTGTPGYAIDVRETDGTTGCGAIVDASGAWECIAERASGTYTFVALQQSRGFLAQTGSESDVPDRSLQGYSAFSAPVEATALAPDPTLPTLGFVPWTFVFGMGGTEFQPGDTTTLTGQGLPPGATVDAEFHSTPVDLGATTVGTGGRFSLDVTIPEDAAAGVHEFVVTITPAPGTGIPSTQSQTVTIVDPPRNRAEPSPEAIAAALADAPRSDRSDPAAPTSLTTVLQPIQAVVVNPVALGGAAVAGLVLLLLVALPAELLNSTISENYDRITRRLPRVRATWWQRFTTWLQSSHLAGGIALTVIAALIFGFADPGFGWDVPSFRLVLACALALFVVGYLANIIVGTIIKRRWGLDWVMELKPLGVVLAAVGVLLSRLIDFSPGFLIGLILGITVINTTSAAQRAKVTIVQATVVFVLSMLGWTAYSILSATTSPDSFLTALAFETTAGITAEGLTALFVGMLPFKLLDGSEIAEYSKWLWAGVYAFIAATWMLVVVPSAWGEYASPMWTWIIVLGAFAVVSLAIYFFFRFTSKDEPEDDPNTEVDESELEDVTL